MRQLIVSAWMSLDSVFDAESMPHWFNPYDSEERQNYIRDGILAADAILFGRTTYQMLAPYWSSMKNNEMGVAAKLNSVPKYVISSTLTSADWNNTTILRTDIEAEIGRLKQLPGKEMQIEGSAILVNSLMNTGLIDEYRFLVHPHIMGSGKHFFGGKVAPHGLKLVSSTAFSNGVMLLCYRPSGK